MFTRTSCESALGHPDKSRVRILPITACASGIFKLICVKDKDKDKDVFIGPKEFVSHMMMTQTKDRLYHQLK